MKLQGRASRLFIMGMTCFAGLCCLARAVAADTADQAYDRVKDQYTHALKIPQKEKKIEALRQCIQEFQNVMQVDADGKVSDKCLYLIAQCYHRIHDIKRDPDDLKSAVESYRNLVQKFPKSPLADDAQYLTGILYMSDDPSQAYLEFVKVGLFYPKGDMKAKAAQKIAELKRQLGCSQVKQTETAVVPQVMTKKKKGASDRGQASSSCPSLSRLDKIQRWSGEDYTRVVLYTTTPVTYQVNTTAADPKAKRPARIYLNLKNCVLNPKMQNDIRVNDEFLQEIRAEQSDPSKARVVIEAQGIRSYRVFSLPDPSRLIVDMRGIEKEVSTSPPSAPSPSPQTAETPKGKPGLSLAQQLGLDVRRIVLDPGHGGKDKGAISPNGTYEKDITLALAKRLKKSLEDQLGCEVILTRTRDVYLSLEERTAIANAKKADLFISIHTNANNDRNYHGTETYFLNLSKDKESARVAAFENATSTKRISDLEGILHDLMLNSKIDESARLAKDVQHRLVNALRTRYNDVRDLGTKQAPFYVLLGAEMPSILIETAFITNEREEHRLKDKAFQEILAKGMVEGIQSYIQHVKNFAKAGDPR